MTARSREIENGDADLLFDAFRGTPWERRGIRYLEGLLAQHREGSRVVLVGTFDEAPVGHVSLVWQSDYPAFRQSGTPEIHDLVVVPRARRRQVASSLLDHAERLARSRSKEVGLGVGLYSDYGPAQRLYVQRGYVPDGRGLVRNGRTVMPGETLRIDDDPVLYFTKALA